jgi:A/G-specific adenine glycosylase
MSKAAPATRNPESRFPVATFRTLLLAWYREHARELPWRGIDDPYATWVSEVMLQQTRVATVIDRYREFLQRFPTVTALGNAEVDDVLALWSGLGYYRRARMLHRAAQVVARELDGKLPSTAAQLRTMPGVGEYTAAAIASLAFGESVAVVDGNVERVLLRILGQPEDRSAAARKQIADLAQQLVPAAANDRLTNLPGEHNQAMMELGATVCVPRSPLCHVAHLFATRKMGVQTQVLLEQRPREASLMPGMLELPPLPLDIIEGLQPALRIRHAITTTNYVVEIFTESGRTLQQHVPAAAKDLRWVDVQQLAQQPLTGLARKVMQKLKVMERRPSTDLR